VEEKTNIQDTEDKLIGLEIPIGRKVLINGGDRKDGKPRLVVYLPMHVIERLKLKPGDEVEVGTIKKTGRNQRRARSGFKKKDGIQDKQESTSSEAERTDEERVHISNPQ